MRLAFRFAAAVAVVVWATAAWVAVVRLRAAEPALTATLTLSSPWVPAPGTPPAIAAPAQGSLAVDAVAGGAVTHVAAAAAVTVRPMASVAKTMTALVILEAHPLQGTDAGPVITVTAADVADYRRIAAQGGSVAPVTLGERLTERDLLLGMMLPSANNLALTGARWVDGTVPAFVARLNAHAAALGMAQTHFADPDGLDPATTSTAADLALLGEAAVANDALVTITSSTSATLPDGTVVTNLDRLLGIVPGWIGVKTGWTPEAGGCLLFAARRVGLPGDPALTIVGAVLDQPADHAGDPEHPELGGAFVTAAAVVEGALRGYAVVPVGPASIPVHGQVSAPWGDSSAVTLDGAVHPLLVRLGDALTVVAAATPLKAPSAAGVRAGTVTVSVNGRTVGSWSLVTIGPAGAPSPWWRLLNG